MAFHLPDNTQDRELARDAMRIKLCSALTTLDPTITELERLATELRGVTTRLDAGNKAEAICDVLKQVQRELKGKLSVLPKGKDVKQLITFCYNSTTGFFSNIVTLPLSTVLTESQNIALNLTQLVRVLSREKTELTTNLPVGPVPINGVGTTPEDSPVGTDPDYVPLSLRDRDLEGLMQFSHFDSIMPGKASPEVVKLLELPIIPVFNRLTSVDELGDRGFDADNLGGYIVMKSAYILGINTLLCKASNINVEEAVSRALAKLSEGLNDKLGLACPVGVPYHKGGWRFFWYSPMQTTRKMAGDGYTRLLPETFMFPFGK